MTARVQVPDRLTPASLETAIDSCRGCDLYREATQAVPGEGAYDARLMLIGEQPGDYEDREGEPFVGPAGRLLHEAMADAGIDRDEVFETNAVKHFRFKTQGKRRIHQTPSRTEVVACRPWLVAELDLVRPDGVVLLGRTAGSSLYGGSFRLGGARGRLADWPSDVPLEHPPRWVLATSHPSAVLRATDRAEARAAFTDELRTAARALAG